MKLTRLITRFIPFLNRKEWASSMYIQYGRQGSMMLNTFQAFIASLVYSSIPWLLSNKESCPGFTLICLIVVVDYVRNTVKLENASETPYLRALREISK